MDKTGYKYKISMVSGDRDISTIVYRQKRFDDDEDMLRCINIIGLALKLPSVDIKSVELIE